MRVIFKLVLFLNLIPSYTLKAQLQSKHKVSTLSVQKLSERDSVMFAGNYAEAVKLGTQLQANTVGKYRELIKLTQGREDSFSKKIRFDALNNIASYYWKTGNYNEAKAVYKEAMAEAELQGDDKKKAIVMLGQAVVADYQSDFETSIKYNLAALNFFENVNEARGIYIVLGNLGNTYIRLRQFAKAVNVLEKGISLANTNKDVLAQANITSSLARAYKGLGNKEKELELKQKAFGIFRNAGHHQGMATVGINLGVFYADKSQIDSAKKYYYIALKSARKINNKGNIALLFNNMASMYIKIDHLDSAIYFTDSADVYAKRSGDRLAQADAFANRADIYRMQRKHQLAENFFNEYVKLKDSIYDEKMRDKVSEMEVRYETAKKEDQIAILSKDNSIKQLELQRSSLEIEKSQSLIDHQHQTLLINQLRLKNSAQQLRNQQLDAKQKQQNIKTLEERSKIQQLEIANRNLAVRQRNYAILGILFTCIAIGLFSFSYYKRQKLRQENILQAEIFRQQELATRAVFEGEQQERIRIARDLHDSIGQMLSVVKMNVSSVVEANNPTLQLVDRTITEVRHISHNLIPQQLNFGLFNALEELCDGIASAGVTKVIFEVPVEAREVSLSQQQELSIYRIVQEVLGNMVKHAKATEITLKVFRTFSDMVIFMGDDGTGFDTVKISESTGLGWKNITTRVRILGGRMEVQAKPMMGTRIEIVIPV